MGQRFSLCGTLRNGRRASRVPAHCGQYLERSCLRCRWADHPRRGAAGDREPRRSWAWHPGRAGSAGNLVAARRRSMSRSAAANTSGGIRSGSRTQANWSNWPDKPGPPRGSPGLSPGCGYRSQTGKHGRDGLGARCSATSDTVTFRAHHRPHITGLGQAEWHHRHDGAGGRVPVSTAVPSPGLHPVVSDRCNATCAPSVLCGRTCVKVARWVRSRTIPGGRNSSGNASSAGRYRRVGQPAADRAGHRDANPPSGLTRFDPRRCWPA